MSHQIVNNKQPNNYGHHYGQYGGGRVGGVVKSMPAMTLAPQQATSSPTVSLSSASSKDSSNKLGGGAFSSSVYQKITRQDRMMFYEANSALEETVKYEANLPQLPETTEIDVLKMKGAKLMGENGVGGNGGGNAGVLPSMVVVGGMANVATITTTTPPPINVLGNNCGGGVGGGGVSGGSTNTIRTQYVKKKDIGHGLKSTLQQCEVKNLSVIAEEAECMHSSSSQRNSAVSSSKSSSASSSASSSTTNCKLADEPLSRMDHNEFTQRIKQLEAAAAASAANTSLTESSTTTAPTKIVKTSFLSEDKGDSTSSGDDEIETDETTTTTTTTTTTLVKNKDSNSEIFEDEKLTTDENMYDKETLIYI